MKKGYVRLGMLCLFTAFYMLSFVSGLHAEPVNLDSLRAYLADDDGDGVPINDGSYGSIWLSFLNRGFFELDMDLTQAEDFSRLKEASNARMDSTDTIPPQCCSTTVWPDTNYPGPFPVKSIITDSSGVDSALLFYKIQTGPWDSTPPDSVLGDWYYFTIPQVSPPKVIRYGIWARDASPNHNAGICSLYGFIAGPVGIGEAESFFATKQFFFQSIPNPFTQQTTIHYRVPGCRCKGAIDVSIEIYNADGSLVKRLVSGKKSRSYHKVVWDGTDIKGEKLISGIYYCLMKVGRYKKIKKLILLR